MVLVEASDVKSQLMDKEWIRLRLESFMGAHWNFSRKGQVLGSALLIHNSLSLSLPV